MRRSVATNETIFALTTGALPSAVAIVKVAGPRAHAIGERIFRPWHRERGMFHGAVVDADGGALDDGLALVFLAPHSHTGDDTVEFHVHGSLAVVKRLEDTLVTLGARPAERGELTYRALMNGKITPADVERLGDVFLARQPADLSRLYARRDGALAKEIARWRDELVRVQAILDTAVDFSEEYSAVVREARQPLEAAIHGCAVISRRYGSFRSGAFVPRLVLAGRPNAGKSSLFNGLLCRYRAIVHPDAGTTRDVIEEDIEIGGGRWRLADTAGVRDVAPGAEKDGIALGESFLGSCQFWLLVVDGTAGWGETETTLLQQFHGKPHLIVWNKADRDDWTPPPPALGALPTAAVDSEQLSLLAETLRDRIAALETENRGPLPTAVEAARLAAVTEKLRRLRDGLDRELAPEILGEESREILRDLTAVVGEVSSEDVLERVFGEFCIGK